MDLNGVDRKKEKKDPSPPGLRPRKNTAPSTSTPVPTASRKRKSSLSGETGNCAKKSTEKQTKKKMIRSPAATKKGEKTSFRLEPPTLLVANSATDIHAGPAMPVPVNLSIGTDGDVDLDLEGSVTDLLEDTATPTSKGGDVPDSAAVQNSKNEDPFAKLQQMMALNFASMKSDNLALSGQLGLLQNNVVGMSETVDILKKEVGGLNTRISNVTAQAIANKSGITSINKKINEMKDTNAKEIGVQVAAAVAKQFEGVDLTSAIPLNVAERMNEMGKQIDKLKAVDRVQRNGNRTRRPASASVSSAEEEESRQFWAARKCLRVSPITPGEGMDLVQGVHSFFENVLDIPSDELHEGAVVEVRKIPARKRNKNLGEVIIFFDSIQTRDCVASYASNIANYKGDPALRPNLRLEIPDHLCGVFRVLEKCAHTLKCKNPAFFKRSIKYDDINLTLALDYCTARGGVWNRVMYEEASAMTRIKTRPAANSSSSAAEDRRQEQSSGDGGEDEEEDQA